MVCFKMQVNSYIKINELSRIKLFIYKTIICNCAIARKLSSKEPNTLSPFN